MVDTPESTAGGTGSFEPNGLGMRAKGPRWWRHNSIVVTLELPLVTPESRVHSTGAAVIGSTAPLPAAALALR